jgi:hypothetical protein
MLKFFFRRVRERKLILENLQELVFLISIFNQKIDKIMTNQKQLAEVLNGVNVTLTNVAAGVTKVSGETTRNNELIVQLKAALANQDNVSPELQAAADAVVAQAGVLSEAIKAVDDLVPDQTEGNEEGETSAS